MSTCTTCYGTNTTQPCASVGCLSTNYGKCITYSGSNLFCQKGSIATFTFAGTAVSPTINTTVVASVTGGSGTGATFSILRTAGQTTYQVTLVNAGSNYEVSDVLTILGTSLGGASPLNDITLTVTTLAAVISNGDNLDTVISNLNNRLCLVSSSSPSGLDYTAFNYQCLRMGGNLEGVGTVITTAQGFTEAVASALCSLNTRLKGVELPPIIVDTYFGGSIVSGTSTLTQVLNKYGEAIGDINDKFTINSPHTCGTFTFVTTLTPKPSPTASLGTWFNWVSTNLCTNFGEQEQQISLQLSEHTTINTFLYGVPQAYPTSRGNNFVNTACLPGGVSNSNIRSAVNLIATELCSLKSTVTNAATQNYTVSPVTCLNTPFPSNSVFGNNSNLAAVSGTTTLQGHLTQIYNILSNLNIKFSSTDFEFVTPIGSCGPEIRLKAGATSGVTCAAVKANVDLECIRDVEYTGISEHDILVRNGSGKWKNNRLSVVIQDQGNVSTNIVTTRYNFELNSAGILQTITPIKFPVISEANLVRSTLLPTTLSITPLAEYSSNPNNLPIIRKIQTSGLAVASKYTGFHLQNTSVSPYTFNNNTTISLFSWINTELNPSEYIDIPLIVTKKSSGGMSLGTTNLVLSVIPTVFSGSTNELISLKNRQGSGGNIDLQPGEYLQIYIGGLSWPTNFS